jgi:hypothetical protein
MISIRGLFWISAIGRFAFLFLIARDRPEGVTK